MHSVSCHNYSNQPEMRLVRISRSRQVFQILFTEQISQEGRNFVQQLFFRDIFIKVVFTKCETPFKISNQINALDLKLELISGALQCIKSTVSQKLQTTLMTTVPSDVPLGFEEEKKLLLLNQNQNFKPEVKNYLCCSEKRLENVG